MRRLFPLFAVSLLLLGGCRADPHPTLSIGSPAPDFSLPGVDGETHTLHEYSASPVLAVVFTCNHCPSSQRYENRIKALYEDYHAKGVAIVAINPDSPSTIRLSDLDATDVADSLSDMKIRAAYRHLEYPYLYDGDTQTVALQFGPVAMPHVFVFDRNRTLQYQGRIDDNPREDLVKSHDARNAIDALLAERPVPVTRTSATGCPTTWRSTPSASDAELTKIEAEPVKLDMAGAETLKTLRGNGTGKLLLVNFWATWCGPCTTEFPDLEATYRMYRDRNFDFVSVSANEPDEKSAVLDFLQKHHASSKNLLFGTTDTFGLQAAFDPAMPSAVPFTLLLAPSGDVVYQELGALDVLKLRRAILANLPDDKMHEGQQAYWAAN